MHQPQGFVDSTKTSCVSRLKKAIYGLKQTPRAWYNELKTFLLQYGFTSSHAETSLFIYNWDGHTMFLLVYADEIVYTGNNAQLFTHFIQSISKIFSSKDMGNLHDSLELEIIASTKWLFLSQQKYILGVL